jgi:hypothetical protein
MRHDLRSTLHGLAPAPRKALDVSRLLQEAQRRRRIQYMAYAAGGLAIAIAGAVTIPALVGDNVPDRSVPPVQTPTNEVTPSPDSSIHVPVFENLEQGWTRAATPPEPRTNAVTVWSGRTSSGRDLVMWGGYSGFGGRVHDEGYAWDPQTNSWSAIAQSPLSARAGAGAVFTGTEVVIWGGYGEGETAFADGAAYNPETDSWRMLPQAPLPPAIPVAAVWTGEEVLIWGSTDRSANSLQGAAFNPTTNEWRPLPDAPAAIDQGNAVWTSQDPSKPQEMIVFGADLDNNNRSRTDHAIGIAYDPSSDTWRELPDVDLSPQASVVAWTGEKAVAWDYELSGREYDPVANRWRAIGRVPLEFFECYPSTETIGSYVFANFCEQAALWDFVDQGWREIPKPRRPVPGTPIAAGEVLMFAGATHESQYNSLWIYAPPPGEECC